MKRDSVVLLCTCSGDCPGMRGIDFVQLSERLRLEVHTDLLAIHPHVCEESGLNLLHDIVKPNRFHLIVACGDQRQEESLKEGFRSAGVEMDREHWKPLAMIGKSTQEIVDSIRTELQVQGFEQPTLHNA